MHDVQQIQRAAIVLQPEDDLLFSVNLYIITKKQGNSCRNCTIAGCILKKQCYICGKFLTIPTNMFEKDGKYIFGVVKVGDKGQIVIPKDARKQYDIKPGDALLLLGDANGMALVKTEIFNDFVGQVMEGLTK